MIWECFLKTKSALPLTARLRFHISDCTGQQVLHQVPGMSCFNFFGSDYSPYKQFSLEFEFRIVLSRAMQVMSLSVFCFQSRQTS